MENKPPVVNVPPVASEPQKYDRNRLLLTIINTAAMQMLDDAYNSEQEPLALASRLLAIQQATRTISQNETLLRGR